MARRRRVNPAVAMATTVYHEIEAAHDAEKCVMMPTTAGCKFDDQLPVDGIVAASRPPMYSQLENPPVVVEVVASAVQ